MGKSTKVHKGPEARAPLAVICLSSKENALELPFTIYNWYLPLGKSKILWEALAMRQHIICLVQNKNKDYILGNPTKCGISKVLKKDPYRNFHHRGKLRLILIPCNSSVKII